MRKPWLTMLSAAIITTLALTACGDDSPPPAVSGTPVAMSEMKFEPSALTVKSGAEVEIGLSNPGDTKHNLTIDDLDIDEDLDNGDATSFTFTAPTIPGEYKIYCDVPGHETAGMVGTLTVE